MFFFSIFVTNLVNVGKKLETKLQYFDIYLHNKNILEYGLLLVGCGRFMIFHIEGRSTDHRFDQSSKFERGHLFLLGCGGITKIECMPKLS